MIRNETQHRRAIREREELVAAGNSGDATVNQRLSELDEALAEYEALRSGEAWTLAADGVQAVGELLIKARIARGLTMSELGELLSMSEQQVGRYEGEEWRRASLWRLEQVAKALGLEVQIQGAISDNMSRA